MTMVENAGNSEGQPAGRAEGEGESDLSDAAVTPADEQTSKLMTAQADPEVEIQASSSRPPTPSSAAAESPPPSRGGAGGTGAQQRNTSSKFASLRAAFEKTGAPANGSLEHAGRARLASSSDLSMEKTRERHHEYEAEIARLKDELENERELRVAFEDKVGSLEEEIEKERELRVGFEDKIGTFGEEMDSKNEKVLKQVEQLNAANEKLLKQAEELAVALEKINQLEQLEDARANDDEASDGDEEGADQNRNQDSAALRRQLSDLKRSISRSTRPTGQLTDTTLRQEIGLLQHEVQNWVVNNFRKVKIEASPAELCEKLTRIAEPEQVVRLRPLYETFDASAKLAIYQATVAVYMMEIFSDTFLFGLRGQQDWARRTRQAAETLPMALDTTTYHRWRAVTFSALRESAAVKEPVESAAGAMAEMICITLNAMSEMEESEAGLGSLRTIVRRAILLAHQVRSQQAQYAFVLPVPDDEFNAAFMEDIVDDIEADEGRIVKYATFPSLFKSVDDDGTKLEPKKTVFRAKILCKEADDG